MRWVIGDVHGMLDSLRGLLQLVARRDPKAKVVFVGDYVNRGPDSGGVIDLLLSLRGAASFVRGNHDDVFDLLLHGSGYCNHPSAADRVASFKWFMNYGLADTLLSYGVDLADLEYAASHPSEERIDKLLSTVPEAHREFIRKLSPVFEAPDMFVAHALWDVDEPDERPSLTERLKTGGQSCFKVLWGRYSMKEITRNKRWKRTGYFGHTPVKALGVEDNVPLRGPKIVLLDTGAALNAHGRLTAVCADTGETIQVDRRGFPVEGG